MNQCANARAVSLERCKRMAQLHSPPPYPLSSSWFFDLHFPQQLLSLSLSFNPPSNCYLSLIFTNTVMFSFHFSLTNIFFLLTLLPYHPSLVLLSCSISFTVLFSVLTYCMALVAAIISTFYISALSFPVLFPQLFIHSCCFQRKTKRIQKRREP